MQTLPPSIRPERAACGLERLVVENSLGEAVVYLQGAQVMHFAPRGERPLLWAADESHFAPDRKNRGGVPLFWPWFAPVGEKSHLHTGGWVRERAWTLLAASDTTDGATELEFTVAPEKELEYWPATLVPHLRVRVSTTLDLSLTTTNHGDTPVIFEDALHTYFAVSDVRQVVFHGLGGKPYIDYFEDLKRKVEPSGPVRVTEPTCHIHFGESSMAIEDPDWGRRITIAPRGAGASVLWSPGDARAAELKDLGDQWPKMVCLESANCLDARVTLPPGATHTTSVAYGVERI
jgi:glucose-6-phosphate 1-epimerase